MPELCTLVDDAVRIVGSHAAIAAPGRKRQAGIGLVELMISAVISLLLVAAVVGLTVSSSSSYHMQTNHARIQENARFAIQLLSRDIRLAGYLGCLTSSTLLTNNLDVAGDGNLYDMRWFLEGLEQGQSAWLPSGGSASALNALADTDAITIRFANPTRGGGLQASAAPTGQIDVDNAAFNFGTGNIAVITDCDKGDISRYPTSRAPTISSNTSPATSSPATAATHSAASPPPPTAPTPAFTRSTRCATTSAAGTPMTRSRR